MTFDASIDGKKISIPTKLTTESFSSPIGQLSGKRATLSNSALTAGLVGLARLKADDIIAILIGKRPAEVGKGDGKKEGGPNPGGAMSKVMFEDLVIVVKAEGRATATD